MPVDPGIVSGMIQGGTSILNAASQFGTNLMQMNYNTKMYDRQRRDALADWNMQNEYNSPKAQMQRLRDAGLNPNLVYGNGADAQGGVVRGTNAQSFSPTAPHLDTEGLVFGYYDLKKKQAEIDNLQTANTVAVQDALLRAAQVAATNAGTARTLKDTETAEFSLNQAKRLSEVSVQAAEANLRKTNADIDYTLDQNERAKAQNAMSLREAAERILKSRAERSLVPQQRAQIEKVIENMSKDIELKKLDIELKKLGIQPGDSIYWRVLGRVVGDPNEFFKKFGIGDSKPTKEEMYDEFAEEILKGGF